jgi:hypothetical protein
VRSIASDVTDTVAAIALVSEKSILPFVINTFRARSVGANASSKDRRSSTFPLIPASIPSVTAKGLAGIFPAGSSTTRLVTEKLPLIDVERLRSMTPPAFALIAIDFKVLSPSAPAAKGAINCSLIPSTFN